MINHNLLPKLETPEGIIKTSCRKCVFKTEVDNVQTGCRYHDRLTKFLDVDGVDVYSLESGDKTYCGITTLCTACTQKVPDDVEDDIKFIDEHLQNQVNLIIEMDKYTTIKEIVNTYQSAISQEIPPTRIVISYSDNPDINPQTIFVALSEPSLNRDGIRFVIVQSVRNTPYDDHMFSCIDKCTTPYFVCFKAGSDVPYNLGSTVDDLINKQMQKFIAICHKDGHGSVYLTRLFKKAMRNIRETTGRYNFFGTEKMITENEEGVLQWNV